MLRCVAQDPVAVLSSLVWSMNHVAVLMNVMHKVLRCVTQGPVAALSSLVMVMESFSSIAVLINVMH